MKLTFLIILLGFLSNLCFAQVSFAKPFISHYTSDDYDAHAQNFGMCQDEEGRYYFANVRGVLSFDGVHWDKIEIKDKAVVLSVFANLEGQDELYKGRVYVGGKNEFGYLSSNKKGEVEYTSIREKLTELEQVGDVWKVMSGELGVYFTSFKGVFIWNGLDLIKVSESDHHLSHRTPHQIFTVLNQKDEKTLALIEGDSIVGLKEFKYSVYGIHEFDSLNYWLFTPKFNVYHLKLTPDNRLDSLYELDNLPFNGQLNEGRVYSYTSLKKGGFALSTLKSGIFIFNEKGELIDNINEVKGMTNAMCLGISEDKEGNLWVSTGDGITKIEYGYPFGILTIEKDVKDMFFLKDKLVMATGKGLFSFEINQGIINEVSVEIIKDDMGRCWDMFPYQNELLVASSYGVSKLDDQFNLSIIKRYNSPVFSIHNHVGHENELIFGKKEGAVIYNLLTKEETIIPLKNNHQVRWIAYDESLNGYWLASLSSGISFYNEKDNSVSFYNTENGLSALYETYVFEYGNDVYLSSDSGFFKMINSHPLEYEKSDLFNGIGNVKGEKIYRLFESEEEVWIATVIDDKETLTRRYSKNTDGRLRQISPELLRLRSTSFYSFCEYNDTVFFGMGQDMIVFDKNYNFNLKPVGSAIISRVKLNKGEVISGGYNFSDSLKFLENEIAYQSNSMTFEFASPTSSAPEATMYSYTLEGFNDIWSDWSPEVKKEYTNLFEGEYTFKVKVKNVFNQIADESAYSFVILPPWYREPFMYFVYILVLSGISIGSVKLYTRKLKREKIELEEIVTERTKEVVLQKEMVESKNKDILASIKYAKRIQDAILPKLSDLEASFKEFSIFFKPRDVVSGDFYWKFETNNYLFFAVVDCTGHGVPGAFVSMTAHNHLNQIVKDRRSFVTGEILTQLNQEIKISFQEQGNEVAQDGMDLSLIRLNKENGSLQFSGAQNALWQVREGEMIVHKADKVSIGGYTESYYRFQTQEIEIKENDSIYLYTDGYMDQFGGENDKKFKSKKLKELLINTSSISKKDQFEIIKSTFSNWKGDGDQVDDVLLVGMKF